MPGVPFRGTDPEGPNGPARSSHGRPMRVVEGDGGNGVAVQQRLRRFARLDLPQLAQ